MILIELFVMTTCAVETCPICLIEFQVSDLTALLPCKHIYHESCLSTWIQQTPRCPVCRREIILQEIQNQEHINRISRSLRKVETRLSHMNKIVCVLFLPNTVAYWSHHESQSVPIQCVFSWMSMFCTTLLHLSIKNLGNSTYNSRQILEDQCTRAAVASGLIVTTFMFLSLLLTISYWRSDNSFDIHTFLLQSQLILHTILMGFVTHVNRSYSLYLHNDQHYNIRVVSPSIIGHFDE